MPYIPKSDRERLDGAIEELADAIVELANEKKNEAAFTGLINYASTTLALRVVRRKFGGIKYWMVAAVTGTFHNVADEFYRRVGAPYEDRQIQRNGDTEEYESFTEDIGK